MEMTPATFVKEHLKIAELEEFTNPAVTNIRMPIVLQRNHLPAVKINVAKLAKLEILGSRLTVRQQAYAIPSIKKCVLCIEM